MYINLRAEMARKRIKNKDLAAALDITESALYEKLAGKTDFKMREAKKIKETFFDDANIDFLYLFKTEEEREDEEEKQGA